MTHRIAMPSYIFTHVGLSTDMYYNLTQRPGVIRLLKEPIPDEQMVPLLALHEVTGAPTVRRSRDGLQLAGLPDGLRERVTRIDKHRRRLTIEMVLLGEVKRFDISFDYDEKHP